MLMYPVKLWSAIQYSVKSTARWLVEILLNIDETFQVDKALKFVNTLIYQSYIPYRINVYTNFNSLIWLILKFWSLNFNDIHYRTKLFIGINAREIRDCYSAKNREKFNPLIFSSSSAICLKTAPEKCVFFCEQECTLTGIRTRDLGVSLSYRASWFLAKKY